jgi:hypothetical protein
MAGGRKRTSSALVSPPAPSAMERGPGERKVWYYAREGRCAACGVGGVAGARL